MHPTIKIVEIPMGKEFKPEKDWIVQNINFAVVGTEVRFYAIMLYKSAIASGMQMPGK
jgi:hypothetical protein